MKQNKYTYVTNSQKKKIRKKKLRIIIPIIIICSVVIAFFLAKYIPVIIDQNTEISPTAYQVKEEPEETPSPDTQLNATQQTIEQPTNTQNVPAPEVIPTDTTPVDTFTYSFGTTTNGKLTFSAPHSDDALVYKYITGDKTGFTSSEASAERLAKSVSEFLNNYITDEMNEYEKELAIHDFLVQNVSYSNVKKKEGYRSPKYHSYGALVDHQAVCQGYSEAFELLCACCGLKCYVVTGSATNDKGTSSHAWNMVLIDGNWYHVDVTWDDPIPEKKQDGISHEYFNVPDDFISSNHTWSEKSEYNNIAYPSCTSPKLFY